MAPALCFRGVTFRYTDDAPAALSDLELAVWPGEVVALVGGNGSGKSTLARLANGLLTPQYGEVSVGGLSTVDHAHRWEIHAQVGLLFQDPEDQIVGATVEDDIAFGLENMGVPREDMLRRVARVLAVVGLDGEEATEPHLLSGGQKQRLALAGVLVLEPSVLVLDEPTSMLDPAGRTEVMRAVRTLASTGVAVVMITQHMEETLSADRLIALRAGEIAWAGPPRDFFVSGACTAFPLGRPPAMELWEDLESRAGRAGMVLGPGDQVVVVSEDDVVAALAARRGVGTKAGTGSGAPAARIVPAESTGAAGAGASDAGGAGGVAGDRGYAVRLDGVRMTYNRGTPFARRALDEVTLDIAAGAVTAVVGSTAAGKSSLLQVMAGVMRPTEGRVMAADGGRIKAGSVGMALQRPEVQLFSATVWDDVAVAPRLRGLIGEGLRERVEWALDVVGLAVHDFGARGPYSLSLGEQRRAALAGVLSLDPAVLVLDEPGSGLDPAARRRLMEYLVAWARGGVAPAASRGPRTLVFTSHDLDEVAAHADHVVVLHRGRVEAHAAAEEVLSDVGLLERAGLRATLASRVAGRLGSAGPRRPATPAALAEWLTGSPSGYVVPGTEVELP
jgi:energy-coupling factor transport system ATP-binding protein